MLNRSLAPMVLTSMLALSLSSLPALASPGAKHGKKGGQEKHPRTVIVIDRDSQRRIVHEYYTGQALPPGLAKRRSLPPGLSKQVRERGHLPPGLQKRLKLVPPALDSRLPVVPPYYRRYFAGRDLLIVDTRTDRIVTVILDVFP